jgi:hypothetical protein
VVQHTLHYYELEEFNASVIKKHSHPQANTPELNTSMVELHTSWLTQQGFLIALSAPSTHWWLEPTLVAALSIKRNMHSLISPTSQVPMQQHFNDCYLFILILTTTSTESHTIDNTHMKETTTYFLRNDNDSSFN